MKRRPAADVSTSMNARTHILQAATLIGAAIVLALVSNAVASRERQMKLVGYYPAATQVPKREPEAVTPAPAPVPATTATVATTTTAPAPAPVPVEAQASPPVQKGQARTPVPPPVKEHEAPKPDVLARFPVHEKQPYIEITYNDVKSLYDAGVLFLDARRTSVYEQGHIAGARPFSVWESDVDDKVAKLFNERSDPAEQAKPIVVYCSGGDCEDSHMLAQKLWGAQFNNVYVYKDGFPDWQKHGAPIHEGTQP
jgi:rhodanese-related sulfurtransferase